jgi:hypothetical protein
MQAMVIEKLCPVCGYEMDEGPRDFNICPSCGTEFGLHDLNSSIKDLREVWIENGAHWHSQVIPEPLDWNAQQQLSVLMLNAPARVSSAVLVFDPSILGQGSFRPLQISRRKGHRRLSMPSSVTAGDFNPYQFDEGAA